MGNLVKAISDADADCANQTKGFGDRHWHTGENLRNGIVIYGNIVIICKKRQGDYNNVLSDTK